MESLFEIIKKICKRERKSMDIVKLDKNKYAGKKFVMRYLTKGYYDIIRKQDFKLSNLMCMPILTMPPNVTK